MSTFVLSLKGASISSKQPILLPNKAKILSLGRKKRVPPSKTVSLLLGGAKTLLGRLKIQIVFAGLEI